MDIKFRSELEKLVQEYFDTALSHIEDSTNLNENLRKAFLNLKLNEDSELPGYEDKPMKFGKFENRVFVAMMTDIRDSTAIINRNNGLINMFLIFYVYAGVVAKIVDHHDGTSTEFLGDGVLNLFDTKENGLESALRNSMLASLDILNFMDNFLNNFFIKNGLPKIDLGIGIDHGITIVTKFGYRGDSDLKAFGTCIYNSSKLSKGINDIHVSGNSQSVWPTDPNGKLGFIKTIVDGKYAYKTYLK